jgi:O-antigen/teichoic acid export membrane protein
VAIAATVALPAFMRYFHAPDAFVVVFALVALGLTAVLLLQRAVFQGAGRFGAFVASNAIEAALKAAAGVATWTLHGGLRMALGGYVAATAAAAGFSAAPWIGSIARARAIVPPAFLGRYVLGIAVPTAALSAVSFADVLLVRHSLDAYASGLYAATALFGRAVLTAVQFVPTVLMPRVVAERSAGRSPARLLGVALVVTLAAIAIALLAAALVPRELLTLVAGKAFAAASPLLVTYTLAMGALAGATVLAAYLIALGRGGFVIPLVLVACAEITAIALYHPSAGAVVHVVLAGHCALFACCIPDALLSLGRGMMPQPSEAVNG